MVSLFLVLVLLALFIYFIDCYCYVRCVCLLSFICGYLLTNLLTSLSSRHVLINSLNVNVFNAISICLICGYSLTCLSSRYFNLVLI